MSKKSLSLGLLAVLVGGLGGGCKKSAPATSLLPPPPAEIVAGIHWLGKQRLAAETNAAPVMAIWSLEESKTLEARTLDRLAVGLLARGASNLWPVTPAQSSVISNQSSVTSNQLSVISNQTSVISNRLSAAGSRSPGTNAPSPTTNQPVQLTGSAALLRPLLDDLLQQESFLNIRQATNQPGELTLAIRLSAERARLWQTNLAALLESLTAGRAAMVPSRSDGWQLQFRDRGAGTDGSGPSRTRTFDLARVGEWTLVGLASGRNALLEEALTAFRENPTGEGLAPANSWLSADIDLPRAAKALSLNWTLPAELPRLTLNVTGDGQTVRTRAQLNFSQPLPFEVEPWNIPTNLIHEPLISFTAIQGLRPWLSGSKLRQGLDLETPPNQLFFWAQAGPEFLSYVAAPMANASNWVERVTQRLLQEPNAYLAAEGMGRFERLTNGPGAVWADLPFMTPYLRPVVLTNGDFIFGGLVPSPLTNRPPPAVLLATVVGDTNLVAYDWELTGPRLHAWLNFSQLIRYALHLAQVPAGSANRWLRAVEPKLGNCVTAVRRTGPAQLSMVRRSGVGLTAAELELLADWLESPQFPYGLHTFLGQPTRVPRPRSRPPAGSGQAGTNSPPPFAISSVVSLGCAAPCRR